MGNRANMVVVENGDWELHYAHWAGCRMLDAVAFGPEHAVRYIRAHEKRPRENWTDPDWADGGTVVDLDQRRMLFFGEELASSMPERRAMLDVLALTWPDFEIGWAYGGTDELADYVGAQRRWESGRRGLVVKRARGVAGLCQVVSVVDHAAGLRFWPLCWGYSAAWQGPGMLETLPGTGGTTLRRRVIPESGVHVDLTQRTVGVWTTTEARGVFDALAELWPGWHVDCWEDGYEEHLRRCGDKLRLPDLDLAAGISSARDWLHERVFQSFEDSPAGAVAGLMKSLDPACTDLELGTNSVFDTPYAPEPAAWARFEAACAGLLAVYTNAA